MKRRQFIRNSAFFTSSTLLVCKGTFAADDRAKVYLNYTQQELDDAYTQAKWAPNTKQVLADQAAAGSRIRAQYPPRTVQYGTKVSEKLDIFLPTDARHPLPVFIFIHGGAWRAMTKESVSFIAPTYIKNNTIFVAPDFDNIPDNTISGMAEQCQKAILWVWKHAKEIGADPNRIYIGGHSSGGHLAAVMLTTDWSRFAAPHNLLKGGVVLSGMCDLEPVLKSVRGAYIKLTEKERIDLSPVFKLDQVKCPVIVAWGSKESPEFKRQSILMAEKLRLGSRLAGKFVLEEVNHFEILNVIASDQSQLAQATLKLIR